MSTKSDFLHWSNLLYVLIVLAPLPIAQGMGNRPPLAWLDPALGMIVAQVGRDWLVMLIPWFFLLHSNRCGDWGCWLLCL